MGQQGIQKLKCQKDDHQDDIDSVCYNQSCTEFRLNCFECMKKGIHHTHHLHDVQKTSTLTQYIENQNKECDLFIKDLNQEYENLTQSFSQLIKGTSYKYSLLKEKLVKLNSQQINDFLNSTIGFNESKQSIIKIISDQIEKIVHAFNNLYNQLNIQSFINYQINDNDLKLSKEMYNQGFNLYQDNKFNESLEQLDKSLQLNFNNYKAQSCKGSCLRKLGRYEDAITWLDKALTIDSKHIDSLFEKGSCLKMLGRYEDAITWLDKALTINSIHVCSLWNKGTCLKMLGRYEDAITWIDKALTIDSKDVYSLSEKGDCLRSLKKFDDSLKYLNQVLSINPNHSFSLITIGQLLEEQQKYLEALNYYDKLLKIQPNDQWTIQRKDFCENQLKE